MELAIASIVSMGYPYEVAKKATASTNSEDLNANIEWIEKNLEDPDVQALMKASHN